MLKLKLQCFGHLMPRASSLEKTLMLGKGEGKRSKATEDEMIGWHHQLNGHEFEHPWEIVRAGKPGVLQFMGSQRIRH